jgi:hypothetical protein
MSLEVFASSDGTRLGCVSGMFKSIAGASDLNASQFSAVIHAGDVDEWIRVAADDGQVDLVIVDTVSGQKWQIHAFLMELRSLGDVGTEGCLHVDLLVMNGSDGSALDTINTVGKA